MVRKNLSEQLKNAGLELLNATDALDMDAQGAMWVYSNVLEDWRYYLVTSLVETLGRRKTYQLLIKAFENSDFPKEMTVEDVQLGSPTDEFFIRMSSALGVQNSIAEVTNCNFNGVVFDGIIYRSIKEPPSMSEQSKIGIRFQKKIKELSKTE